MSNIVQNILFLLDESGSMSSMGAEPVQAVNKFIQEQKSTLGDDGATFSLWKFNTTVSKVIDDIPLKDVVEFIDFLPNDMTSLYDAIGSAIKNKVSYDNVICIILTDGLDNSSVEYTLSNVKSMINEMETKHNWKFVYLGANQDAFTVGSRMGMAHCANYRCEPGEMLNITRAVSDSVSSYRCQSARIGLEATFNIDRSKSAPPNLSSNQPIGRQMSSE
jgi:uncharacterized protein YegL